MRFAPLNPTFSLPPPLTNDDVAWAPFLSHHVVGRAKKRGWKKDGALIGSARLQRSNAGTTPAQRRHNAGTTPAQRRHNAGTTPAQRRHNAGTTPAQRRHNAGTTPISPAFVQ
jgi:hypothetical protein